MIFSQCTKFIVMGSYSCFRSETIQFEFFCMHSIIKRKIKLGKIKNFFFGGNNVAKFS